VGESREAGIMNTLVPEPEITDRGRPHDKLYEDAVWADMFRVQGDELFDAYMVDNQAIVIPETIDAIRALTRSVEDGTESIARTNAALDIGPALLCGKSALVPRRRDFDRLKRRQLIGRD
jgi:glyceraldehyde-3-phosphate dehydrogenase (NAD(P))